MSILGVLVRTRPGLLPALLPRLCALPGVDVALNPGDGRLAVLIEDAAPSPCADDAAPMSAAQVLAHINSWHEVLNTSLVYEYSGPDMPAAPGEAALQYTDWRTSLADLKHRAQLGASPAPAAPATY